METVRRGGLGTFDLAGKVAVVGDGSGAIGAATARRLAAAGATVVLGCRRQETRVEAVLKDLPGEGHWAVRLPVDDTTAVDHAASLVSARHDAVDVLVNAAGTTRKIDHGDLDALDDTVFDQIYTVNVRGVFSVVRACGHSSETHHRSRSPRRRRMAFVEEVSYRHQEGACLSTSPASATGSRPRRWPERCL